MKKNRLYVFLLALIGLGYGWLFLFNHKENIQQPIGCVFKKVTNYPCPSCGTTRSVSLLMRGDFWQALMLVIPIWIGIDLLKKTASFYRVYLLVEKFISKKPIALFLVVLVLLNWYWNIKKNL